MTGMEVAALSMAPADIHARMEYSKALATAELIPVHYQRKPANVLIAVETAAALNIPAIQALAGIAVINGRATLTADLMAAVVRKAGHKLRVREHDGAVTATLIRADDPDFAYEVTWDRGKAEQAGLWGKKGPWVQYPGQMLRSRAITEVCRQGASDALFGMVYSPEELGADVDSEGNILPTTAASQPAPAPTPARAHVSASTSRDPMPSPSAVETPANTAQTPADATVGDVLTIEQQAQIIGLQKRLGKDAAEINSLAKWLTGGRVNQVENLSASEADSVIDYMEKRAREMGAFDSAPDGVLDVEIVDAELVDAAE